MFSFGICFKESFQPKLLLASRDRAHICSVKGNQTKPVFVSSDALMLEQGFQQDGGLSITNVPSAILVKQNGLCL